MSDKTKLWEHPAIAGIIGGLLPAAISVACVIMTYSYTTASQNRQTRLEAMVRFDQSSSQVIEAAGKFISAVNDHGKGLQSQRDKIRELSAKQMIETETLSHVFPAVKNIADYKTALSEFNTTSQGTENTTEMRPWAESFGRVIDSRDALNKELLSNLGLST